MAEPYFSLPFGATHEPECARSAYPKSHEPCTCNAVRARRAALMSVQPPPIVGAGAAAPAQNNNLTQRQWDREPSPKPAEHPAYEYLLVEGPRLATLDEVCEILNKHGAEGWQLTTINYGNSFIFTRRKQ